MSTTDREPDRGGAERIAGGMLLAGTIATVAWMARHPTVSAHDLEGALLELAAIAEENRLVHGSIVASSVLAACGLTGLVAQLGVRSLAARAGALAWLLGLVAFAGAALVNGFLLSSLAEDYAGKPAATIEQVRPLLRLCHHANQTLAQAGTLATSAAILAWSLALLARGSRGLGVFGLLVGLLPIAGIASRHLTLHLHGMLAVVLAQALWSLAVAIVLLRGGPRTSRSA